MNWIICSPSAKNSGRRTSNPLESAENIDTGNRSSSHKSKTTGETSTDGPLKPVPSMASITNTESSGGSESSESSPRVMDPDLISPVQQSSDDVSLASSSNCSSPSQSPQKGSPRANTAGSGGGMTTGRQSTASSVSNGDTSLRRRVASWLSNPGYQFAKRPDAPSEETSNRYGLSDFMIFCEAPEMHTNATQ